MAASRLPGMQPTGSAGLQCPSSQTTSPPAPRLICAYYITVYFKHHPSVLGITHTACTLNAQHVCLPPAQASMIQLRHKTQVYYL